MTKKYQCSVPGHPIDLESYDDKTFYCPGCETSHKIHKDMRTEEIDKLQSELLSATRKLHDEARNEEEKYLESRLIELFGSLEEGIKKIHLTVLERDPVIYEQVVQEDGSIMYSMTESYRLRMKTREELYREGIFPEDPYKKAERIAE